MSRRILASLEMTSWWLSFRARVWEEIALSLENGGEGSMRPWEVLGISLFVRNDKSARFLGFGFVQAVADEALAEEFRFAIGMEAQAEDAFDPGAAGGQEDDD